MAENKTDKGRMTISIMPSVQGIVPRRVELSVNKVKMMLMQIKIKSADFMIELPQARLQLAGRGATTGSTRPMKIGISES